ncbi:adenylate kinase-like [Diorhabda sublineata]|uniref:adenylate kinase-like n=1 Tax=Diorhabda sublineata TaxID=1163346 RepID=UPI0024E09670|nr:adenylate kinase-like [Diorhabda sublineata]
MSGIQNKNLPIIWITGPPNSGKKTIGRLIRNKYEFDYINITDLLREEINKESSRAVIIKRHINAQKKVPDYIVMDLLKESLLNSTTDKGFVISNFPKTIRQAEAFTREIGNVSFVFYLYTGFPLLIDRAQRKSPVPLDHDVLRRNLSLHTREIKACLGKFAVKIESINTSGLPEETFPKVESALIRRMNITRPIITETDYIQTQKIQQNDQQQKSPSIESINPEDIQNPDKSSKQEELSKEEECNKINEIDSKEEMKIVENKIQELKEELVNSIMSNESDIDNIVTKDNEYEEKEIKFTELNQKSI